MLKKQEEGAPKENNGFTKKLYFYYYFPFTDITQTAKLSAMIPSSFLVNDLPPAFSRLPPDGHEFPPNYIEPIILRQSDTKATLLKPLIASNGNNGINDNTLNE